MTPSFFTLSCLNPLLAMLLTGLSPRQLQRFFGFILIQAVIIKLMTTSHPVEGTFASDFSKDSEAEAEDKIVIDKLFVNKLTELLINSIYSVHISRRSEIFLTSLDMHLAKNSVSHKNNKAIAIANHS